MAEHPQRGVKTSDDDAAVDHALGVQFPFQRFIFHHGFSCLKIAGYEFRFQFGNGAFPQTGRIGGHCLMVPFFHLGL